MGKPSPSIPQSAQRGRRGVALLWALGAIAVAGVCAPQLLFTGSPVQPGAPVRVALAAAKVELPPSPVLECDGSCVEAIEKCLDEGCSVEAIMKLDAKLAEDEEKIQATMTKIQEIQKTEPTPEAPDKLAWMKNFLDRSASLRGQLLAMKPAEDTSFFAQIIKAASVAFGRGSTKD